MARAATLLKPPLAMGPGKSPGSAAREGPRHCGHKQKGGLFFSIYRLEGRPLQRSADTATLSHLPPSAPTITTDRALRVLSNGGQDRSSCSPLTSCSCRCHTVQVLYVCVNSHRHRNMRVKYSVGIDVGTYIPRGHPH